MKHTIEWIDRGREPQCLPNPEYPAGIDAVIPPAVVGAAMCRVDLPYPAKRCGVYVVTCSVCLKSVGCTTAGRPDDPRSLTFPCMIEGASQ